ncbi:hypothetical protein HRbin01_00033 [archaeon HR01]|nr:hypothetical protein HRbin01_00033 [archaeon HR01]
MNSETIDVLESLSPTYIRTYVRSVDEDLIIVEGKSGGKKFRDTLPRYIRFDQECCYNIGLWLGDRWGGKSRVGIKNKDVELIAAFYWFLRKKMKQDSPRFLS